MPNFAGFAFVLALCLATGCARPREVGRTEAASAAKPNEQSLPFHPNPDPADNTFHPALPQDRAPGDGIPFPAASRGHILPAGTLVTVLLDNPLFISRMHPGDTFTASLDGPLAFDKDILAAGGTQVTGRVESAQPSIDRPGLIPHPGYVQLTLLSIRVDGKALDLQTANLFAKGSFPSSELVNASHGSGSGNKLSGLQLQKGRRLTFRLTAPVAILVPNSVADRRYSDPSSE